MPLHNVVKHWHLVSKGAIAALLAGAMVASGAPSAAVAAPSKPNSELGYPSFFGDDDPIPDSGVAFDPSQSYLTKVFENDVAAGAGTDTEHDFWIDEMLARHGTAPGGPGETAEGTKYRYDSDGNEYLFSRGRAAFMRTHNTKILGFGGDVAYWDSLGGKDAYTISVSIGDEKLELTEDTDKRKQTPSYWRSTFTSSSHDITVVETKYITDGNVLVTGLSISAPSDTKVRLTAQSPFTSNIVDNELNGTMTAHNNVTTIRARFSGNGMSPDGKTLIGEFDVPGGGAATTKLQLGLTTDEIPASTSEYEAMASGKLVKPADAYKAHVTAYNKWWADNIPYIETPEHNIDKTLFYRWWLTRFNFLDANMPGNTLQFPTSIEGVLGYNNAIDLTIGMFIDDLKWLRDPAYSYGTWVSAGETAGASGEYRDNPADPSNWNATHTQYITEAAWKSYQVHGGPASIAELLAAYGAADTKGQIDSLDSNGNDLLDTDWNAWTGNDADAVSFAEHPGQAMDRAESAYVYAGAVAAAQAYRLVGDEEAAEEMDGYAKRVKDAVLGTLWNSEENMVQHVWAEGPAKGEFAKWKEVNNFYPYAVDLMPSSDDDDYDDDYEKALRLFADAEQYPVFPFFTANQADKAESGTGTNNFSVINSTVIFRIYQAALRQYHSEDAGYVTPEQFKQLLYWNAFAHYQGGDNRYPDQNEFWADGSAAEGGSIAYRSWIHHTQLGTTNWTMIEDVAGLRARADSKIELDPIALPDWGHFAVNNLSYHGQDLSIAWNDDETYDAPKGYSLYVDGTLAFTVDSLSHVVYDPATGEVTGVDGDVSVASSDTTSIPGSLDVAYDSDSRVTDIFAKAGQNIDPAAQSTVNVAKGAAAEGSSQASGDNRAASTATDGSTVAQNFWAPATTGEKESLTVSFDEPQTVDDVRLYFYQTSSSTTVQGFAEPSTFTLEYLDGEEWKPVPEQARTPAAPEPNYNRVQFPEVQTSKLRATFTPRPGYSVGVKEFEAFHTGIAAPESTNAAPSVTASVGDTRGGATKLGGVIKDDGLPSGELTTSWSVVSGPDGGEATFDDASKASTVVRFSVAGTYVLALTASDGELESTDTVTVDGVTSTGKFNVAPDASEIAASFTAGWNNINAVNDGEVVFSGGDNSSVWATWDGDRPEQQWLEYDWGATIPLTSASVGFWHDNTDENAGDGVAVPEGWSLQYWDAAAADGAGDWADVPLADDSSFGVAGDEMNEVTFSSVVETSKLRAVFDARTNGTSFAAVGVSEFEAYALDPVAFDQVDVATEVGTAPELPETVGVVYDDGHRGELAVTWTEIDPAQYAQEGEFEVEGVVMGASTTTHATVWVRSDLDAGSLTLNGTVAIEQTVHIGTELELPDTVTGTYNNGINRSGLPVEWNADDMKAVDTTKAGDYVVNGTATDDLNPSQTAKAKATVHVVDPDADPVDRSALQALYDDNVDREQGAFTDGSWADFEDALEAAAEVLADSAATQKQIDAAAAVLQKAIDGLKEAEPEVTIAEITIESTPDKTEYAIGDKLDLSGLKVVARWSDGSSTALSAKQFTVSGFDSAEPGTLTVTVTSTENPEATASFDVRVLAPGEPGGDGGNGGAGAGNGESGEGGTSGTSDRGALGVTGPDGAALLTTSAIALALLALGGLMVARRRRRQE